MSTVEDVRDAGNLGIASLQNGRRNEAALHFETALNCAEELEDERTRRDEIAVLAVLFSRSGFPDLALSAAEEAVELDRKFGLTSLAAQDLLEVGIANLNMGNLAAAENAYREALQVFLKRKEWANAASANTNLASIAAQQDVPKAIELLQLSLTYLEKEPFDDTEMQTRAGLLQLLDMAGGDPDLAVANAEKLCSRFLDQVPERDTVLDLVRKATDRYLREHREIDRAAWMARHFPMI